MDLPLEFPGYVGSCIDVGNKFLGRTREFDDLVYLYGSTCVDEVSLTMTLAHELQHAIQHSRARQLWAASSLVHGCAARLATMGLKLEACSEIPTEREARIVSKRVAESIFGKERVVKFISNKIAEQAVRNDPEDFRNWNFIASLEPPSSFDLDGITRSLFGRLRDQRSVLEETLQANRANPDFTDFDLDCLFASRQPE
jgi:hypothetical protein